jgi:hypothetical protein
LSGFHSKRILRQPAQEEAGTETRRRVTPRIYQRHGEIWVRHCREAAPIQLLRGGSGEANGEHTEEREEEDGHIEEQAINATPCLMNRACASKHTSQARPAILQQGQDDDRHS